MLQAAYSSTRLNARASRAQIAADCEGFARNNSVLGITGFLIVTPLNFMQFIEGPDEAVASLLARIQRDQRHSHIRVFHQAQGAARLFPSWAMREFPSPLTQTDYGLLTTPGIPDGVASAVRALAA